MRGEYFIVGAIFVVLGIFLLAKGFSKSDGKSATAIKSGAVGFFGPFPLFGFASDKKTLYLLLGAGLLLLIIFWLLQFMKK